MPTDTTEAIVSEDRIRAALATVNDPEIRRPITELDMVDKVEVIRVEGGCVVAVRVLLTIAGCPLRDTITKDVTAAVRAVPGVTEVRLELGVMTDEQRTRLKTNLRGPTKDIQFARPESRTRIYAIASGKGGVGKSTVTVNLAAALAAKGLAVGLLDADIYGFSIPRMMGVTGQPTQVDDMMLPPVAHGVRVISVGMFVENWSTPIPWRGPMLHRALQQFLADVYWGDLDVLLLDLPPGTGDIAISTAQLIPTTEILVVTTPQTSATEVAERAGTFALQTRQKIAGVVENMSPMTLPDGSVLELFGSGGGQKVADSLSRVTGAPVPLIAQIPLDPALREAGDSGLPLVLRPEAADSPAAKALQQVADDLAARTR
ncbi:MAG: Mrp/NBP35 family ATP-binding protein, partial [Actinomycetota bacterium]|nr:Mrp/NBP35 family ATP-binding protein [Actinomycetota bacterium]